MSLRACSRDSAMCTGPATRQFARDTVVPCSRAVSSTRLQWCARALNPPVDVAAGESMESPHLPAVRGPDGDTDAATAISMCGRV